MCFYCKNEHLEVSFGSCWVILGPCYCILSHHRAMMDQHGVIIAHLGSSLELGGEKVNIPRATGLCKFKKQKKTV